MNYERKVSIVKRDITQGRNGFFSLTRGMKCIEIQKSLMATYTDDSLIMRLVVPQANLQELK
jgi:hypothetical protein